MLPDIRQWIVKVCKQYGLSSFYLPQKDIYMIHFKGKALQGFNSKVFYQIPKLAREKQLLPLLKLGLLNNYDEKNRENLLTKKRLGKLIYES